jgi:hypothetical protein
MARFPIIDSPCPLGQDEIAGIAGHCRHCGETVHSLDGIDDAERSAFMSRAKGSICVSYRLPMRIGAALALALAAPVFGQDSPAAAPCEKAPAVEQQEIVVMGSVREPANAEWTEDMSLPELPTAPDDSPAGK